MLLPARPNLLVVILVILVIFYLTGPFSARGKPNRKSNADARLMRWLETVTPGPPFITDHGYDPPLRQPMLLNRPLTSFNPFPLGRPSGTSRKPTKKAPSGDNAEFYSMKWEFQQDLDAALQKFDLTTYKNYQPHNWKRGTTGKPTFATFLSTPQSSVRDPYFAAAMQLVWRTQWSPFASRKYPFTVFVAPHITQQQRDFLSGAGAIIRELPEVPWEPEAEGVMGRWKDLFSKIHMWNQTDFSRIAFLDCDAFPVKNIDDIFDAAPGQRCNRSALVGEDAEHADEICDYTFAGVRVGSYQAINVGVVVLEPNERMHQRLLRNYPKVDQYDNSMAEQAFLNWQFGQSSPFPALYLDREWNGYYPQADEKGKFNIVHEKIWAWKDMAPWLSRIWPEGWRDMVAFYDSAAFKRARELDNGA